VTASTGSGSGTLGLNLVDDDSIADLAGNVLAGAANGSFTGQVYTFDRTAPTVVSINRAASSPTNAASVTWTVTFSEPVSNVVAARFALVNSGLTGSPAITNVTGGPTTWTVTASTGTGAGTLGLNLTSVGTIADPAGNALSATLPVVGEVYAIDKTKPVPSAFALSNGTGTPGTVDLGDKVTVTYSETLKVSSLCSTWSGDGSDQSLSDATVTITNGNGSNNDTLSGITSPTCTFNFGSVDLVSSGWVSTTRTFGATGTKSTVQWNAATKTLTITLGTASGAVGSGVANVVPVYTPSTAITDPAGNTMNATGFNGTSSRF
jgi:hypothetical protein